MKTQINYLSRILFAIILTGLLIPLFGVPVSIAFGIATILTAFLPMPKNVLGLNNTNNLSARASFDHAKNMFFLAFRNKFKSDDETWRFVNSLKLSQSEIRLEVELNTTSNTFVFGVTPNQSNTTNVVFNTENRLQLQDSLCAYEYGIFVGQPSSRTDTAWQLKTYGSQPTFAGADANALNSTFYSHGTFVIKANNDVIMPYRGLFNHWYRPQTQQTGAFGVGSPEDQIRGAEDAMITEEPNIILIGSKNYQPTIQLPTAMASAAAFMRCVVIFRGILAQNSTVVS
jgi:hypothetical protein